MRCCEKASIRTGIHPTVSVSRVSLQSYKAVWVVSDMSHKATTDFGESFAPKHYGVYGEQFPGNTRVELQQGKRKIHPPWMRPPEAHTSRNLYPEAFVAWNGGPRPPEPEGGKRLVKVPARPITDFTTATTRAPLPATKAEDVEAARSKLPPGTFKPIGLGAGPVDGTANNNAGGAPAHRDTKNSCYFTSAPGAHTGYATYKAPPASSSQWVP